MSISVWSHVLLLHRKQKTFPSWRCFLSASSSYDAIAKPIYHVTLDVSILFSFLHIKSFRGSRVAREVTREIRFFKRRACEKCSAEPPGPKYFDLLAHWHYVFLNPNLRDLVGTQPGHSLVVLPLTFGSGQIILKTPKTPSSFSKNCNAAQSRIKSTVRKWGKFSQD